MIVQGGYRTSQGMILKLEGCVQNEIGEQDGEDISNGYTFTTCCLRSPGEHCNTQFGALRFEMEGLDESQLCG
jgi:hypothetical protein